jgi:hypothetical protein
MDARGAERSEPRASHVIDERRLIRSDFQVPQGLETEEFRLRMLTVNDLVKDYDAVMSSVEHLKSTFSAISGDDWPEGLTLEEDLIDLGWHQREFTLGFSFAYTVMSLDESLCLGCVYFEPTAKADYDVMITMWVRASELEGGLDRTLFKTVKQWVASDWPFSNPAYPGRDIPLAAWHAFGELR